MKKHISLSVIALVVAAVLFGSAASQGKGDSRAQPAGCCHPKAEDLVIRDGAFAFMGKRLFMPLYKVPPKRVLVVTYIAVGVNSHMLSLIERSGGKDTTKADSWLFNKESHKFTFRDSSSGLRFAPGALVILRKGNGGAGRALKIRYHLRGYLTDR